MKNLILTEEFKKPEFYFIASLPIQTAAKEVYLLKLSYLKFIEADGSYSKIYSTINNNPFHTSKNIGYYEKFLPTHSFLRVHSKYIVNINHIQYIKRDNHWWVELTDKSVVKISDDKRIDLLNKLGLKNDSFENLDEI